MNFYTTVNFWVSGVGNLNDQFEALAGALLDLEDESSNLFDSQVFATLATGQFSTRIGVNASTQAIAEVSGRRAIFSAINAVKGTFTYAEVDASLEGITDSVSFVA